MMRAYDGSLHQGWHRDRPHWDEHPFRMDYIQLMVYLSDVDEETHCFSLSPEAVSQPVLEDKEEQLKQGGEYHLHGPAGTCALFNVARAAHGHDAAHAGRAAHRADLLRASRPGTAGERFEYSGGVLAG